MISAFQIKNIAIGFFFIFVIVAFATLTGVAQVEQPEFLITWRAQSYAPPEFDGKLLPAPFSPIVATFEILVGGSFLDLSGENINWYLDGKLLDRGVGVQTVAFRAGADAGTRHDLRIQINGFQGKDKIAVKTIEIPIARPQAIIEAPFPENNFSTRTTRVKGRPYFFNVQNLSNLSFAWEVNGETPTDFKNPDLLSISLAELPDDKAELRVNLKINNPANIFSEASDVLKLYFRK